MKTYIAYFDETGDDGVTTASSDHFILTSLYMPAESWQQNFKFISDIATSFGSTCMLPCLIKLLFTGVLTTIK